MPVRAHIFHDPHDTGGHTMRRLLEWWTSNRPHPLEDANGYVQCYVPPYNPDDHHEAPRFF